jgi:hypothetical protein
MEPTVTRLSTDNPSYKVDAGGGTRFFRTSELKEYLLYVGLGDAAVAAVLDISRNETITVNVTEKAA